MSLSFLFHCSLQFIKCKQKISNKKKHFIIIFFLNVLQCVKNKRKKESVVGLGIKNTRVTINPEGEWWRGVIFGQLISLAET
jgi:hypothetical protein